MKRILFICLVFGYMAIGGTLMAEKRIFISGGAGFIGSNFLTYMFEKYPDYEFVVLDALTSGALANIPEEIRQAARVQFIEGNINDEILVGKIMAFATDVVHFAAEVDVTTSLDGDDIYYKTNVDGTRKLLQALLKELQHINRFVNISSSAVYGNYDDRAITEQDLLNPINPYGASKAAADRLVYAYGKAFEAPVVNLRLFNNFGPGQKLGAIPRFIALTLEGKPITIHGDGEQKRDWLYVTDTARAIDCVLHKEPFSAIRNEVFNLGTENETSVNEAAYKIVKGLNGDMSLITHIDDVPGQVKRNFSNSSKAQHVLGWTPLVSFDEGLEATIEWYKAHPIRCARILSRD